MDVAVVGVKVTEMIEGFIFVLKFLITGFLWV